MSGSSYRNLLKLCKSWPVDTTKTGGRDLGEYLRHRIAATYRQGEATSVDEERCSAIHASLARLATDKHRDSYSRSSSSSALGLTKEECNGILSNEFIQQLRYRNMTFKEKLLGSFKKE